MDLQYDNNVTTLLTGELNIGLMDNGADII